MSRVEILDDETNETLASFTDRQLNVNEDTRMLRFPPWSEQPKLFLWIRLDPDKALPKSVIHRLIFTDPLTSLECLAVTVYPQSIATSDPVILAPPVGTGLWVANETSSNQSHHRLADFTLDGRETVPQRFAVDLMKVVDLNVCNGSVDTNECFWSFSEDLLAVADGTVVTASDGLEDNVMGAPKSEFSREDITGNCVVIDIGGGKFAHYNHIKNGTVCVKSGDPVTRGMVIGKIGNSGSSDAPHLHFQVSDRADFLTGEGLPFVFESFTVHSEYPYSITVLSDPRTAEALENQVVIEFN